MGPQCFRAVCLAMCSNSTILSLNLSDNKTDTDTAVCITCIEFLSGPSLYYYEPVVTKDPATFLQTI